jgi:hypothetical protein
MTASPNRTRAEVSGVERRRADAERPRAPASLVASAGAWAALAAVDVWAGSDVLDQAATDHVSGTITDKFGTDVVLDRTYVQFPDLLALIVGLLLLICLPLLWRAPRFGSPILVALALVSVIALAGGGHVTTFLATLLLAIGEGLLLHPSARRFRRPPAPQRRRPLPGPTGAAAGSRRPSPRPMPR